MDKILVDLFVPAIGKHFDVFIPDFLQIKIVCDLLGPAVSDLSDRAFISSGQEILCSVEQQQIFNPEQTLRTYGVKNGETLLLC